MSGPHGAKKKIENNKMTLNQTKEAAMLSFLKGQVPQACPECEEPDILAEYIMISLRKTLGRAGTRCFAP